MKEKAAITVIVGVWIVGLAISLGITGMVIYALYLGIKFLQTLV